MNKNFIALAGLLAVCGFMTGCCKKKCEPKSDQRRDASKKKHYPKKGRARKYNAEGRNADRK
jgi:hypothetical protein